MKKLFALLAAAIYGLEKEVWAVKIHQVYIDDDGIVVPYE